MRTLRLLSSRPKAHPFPIVSWLIRLFEWSSVSHVGVYFCSTEKVWNAHFDGILEEEREDYKKKHEIEDNIAFIVTEEEEQKILKFLESIKGAQKGYWSTLIGAAIPQLLRTLSFGLIKIPNLSPFHKGYTCSWLVREIVEKMNMVRQCQINYSIKPECYTTKDAIKLAKKLTKIN